MANDSPNQNNFTPEAILAFGNFVNDLTNDLMPFIKENYPISDNREHTAIAGLSMGGRETLNMVARIYDLAAYFGAFQPAPGLMSALHDVDAQLTEDCIAAIPDEYKTNTFVLINNGHQDGIVGANPWNYHNAFVDNGVKSIYYIITGGHDFGAWSNGLYHFAKNIFNY